MMADDRIIPDKLVSNSTPNYNHLLILIAAHPAPEPLVAFYKLFAASLATKFQALGVSEHAYIYTPEQLHITVATLHPSKPGSSDLSACASVWTSVLNEIFVKNGQDSVEFSDKPGNGIINDTVCKGKRPRLRLCDATMDDGVGVLLWEDASKVFSDWRDSVREISKRPDVVDKLSEAGSDATVSRIPEIVHSTVLRWRSSPDIAAHELKTLFTETFHEVLRAQEESVMIYVDSVRIVEEEARCMERRTTHRVFTL